MERSERGEFWGGVMGIVGLGGGGYWDIWIVGGEWGRCFGGGGVRGW